MSIKVEIHSLGQGHDALTNKQEAEGLTVSFENEAPSFLSWKSFKQLLSFKSAQIVKAAPAVVANPPATRPTPTAVPANGSVPVAAMK